MPQRVKVTLSLDSDALELLNQSVSERKRGWYVSQLLRQALGGQHSLAVTEVISMLRTFEQQIIGHREPTPTKANADATPRRAQCRVKETIMNSLP